MVIFRDKYDFALFENLLEIVQRREELNIEAYSLMPNHFHAVVEAELDRLSRAMHRLKGVYAQGFNARYERVGPVFQGRFDARLIDDEKYLATACEYVWNNPVRAELCADPDDWPWSGRMRRYARACTGESAGAHEQIGDTSPVEPFRRR
jgi:REP element-mobilizing transposase RayT